MCECQKCSWMFLNFTFHLQTDVQSNFHIGEVVTSLQKSTLIPGGSESLVYTTLSGSIGILVPFASHEVSRQSSCGRVLLLSAFLARLYTARRHLEIVLFWCAIYFINFLREKQGLIYWYSPSRCYTFQYSQLILPSCFLGISILVCFIITQTHLQHDSLKWRFFISLYILSLN